MNYTRNYTQPEGVAAKCLIFIGGRYMDRTCDPCSVNASGGYRDGSASLGKRLIWWAVGVAGGLESTPGLHTALVFAYSLWETTVVNVLAVPRQ